MCGCKGARLRWVAPGGMFGDVYIPVGDRGHVEIMDKRPEGLTLRGVYTDPPPWSVHTERKALHSFLVEIVSCHLASFTGSRLDLSFPQRPLGS